MYQCTGPLSFISLYCSFESWCILGLHAFLYTDEASLVLIIRQNRGLVSWKKDTHHVKLPCLFPAYPLLNYCWRRMKRAYMGWCFHTIPTTCFLPFCIHFVICNHMMSLLEESDSPDHVCNFISMSDKYNISLIIDLVYPIRVIVILSMRGMLMLFHFSIFIETEMDSPSWGRIERP